MEAIEDTNVNNDLTTYDFFDINSLINKDNTALIRVKGNHYSGMFIYEGDIVIADTSIQPFDNSRVIVSMSDFLSIKIFRRVGDRNFIQSKNYKFMPLSVGDIHFEIVGTVTGVIHSHNYNNI